VTDAHERRLLVVTAVKAETRAVLAVLSRTTRTTLPGSPAWLGRVGDRAVTVVQGGIGPARAAAALAAMPATHDLVVAVGFAGALVLAVNPGDVLLPETVVWDDARELRRYTVAPAAWRNARAGLERDGGLHVHTGPLLSSPVVVPSPERKRDAAARTGAVAVEMETAALIAGAAARDVPVLALRVALDGADVSLEGLPEDLDSSWTSRAKLVGRPRAWPVVARVAREFPRATRALTRAAALVLPVV
jgi:adenosylhomocysteine nucleosidase